MTADRPRFAADDLRRFVTDVFVRLDVPQEDARLSAETLVHADLLGIDSHGVAHMARHPGYVVGLRGGWVNPRPEVRVLRETPSTVALDADGGLGVAVAPRAMARALDKAAAVGCGFAAVRNSRHIGAAAHYSLMALDRGMIGIAMCNGPGTAMVPTFGREAAPVHQPRERRGTGPARRPVHDGLRDDRGRRRQDGAGHPRPASLFRQPGSATSTGRPSTDPRDFFGAGPSLRWAATPRPAATKATPSR